MRFRLLGVVAVTSLLAAASATAAPAATSSALHATFVGDSVSASILYVGDAQRRLEHGVDATVDVRLDLKVCRRLVQPSCSYQGVAPSTALQAVQAYGRSLGKVLIVKVGYNESAAGYGQGIDRVVRAALADGATGVVWVTLRESGSYASLYHATNAAIRQAAKRWPQLVVADWNAYSAGKPWFASDGLHLSVAGADALASFLRPYVLEAAKHRA
jgi:hypothetical protein